MSNNIENLINVIDKLKNDYEELEKRHNDSIKIITELSKKNMELNNKIRELEEINFSKKLGHNITITAVYLNQNGLNIMFSNGKIAVLFGPDKDLRCKYKTGNNEHNFWIDLYNGNLDLMKSLRTSNKKMHVFESDNIISNIKPFTVKKFEELLIKYNFSDKCIKANIEVLKMYLEL